MSPSVELARTDMALETAVAINCMDKEDEDDDDPWNVADAARVDGKEAEVADIAEGVDVEEVEKALGKPFNLSKEMCMDNSSSISVSAFSDNLRVAISTF